MKFRAGVVTGILLLVLLPLPVAAAPVPPNAFYGTVTINGAPAPDGATVAAKISGVQYIACVTASGKYGYDPWFNVPSDDPDTSVKDGGVSGDTVEFYVNGIKAAEEATFQWGARTKLDLTAISPTPTPTPTTTPLPPPAQPPATTPTPTPMVLNADLMGTAATFSITTQGKILETIKATSGDGQLTMTISQGTIALDKNNKPLGTLYVNMAVSPPVPPQGTHIIGLAYDFGPGGANFNPPMTLEYSYDPKDIPAGVREEELVLAYYDAQAKKWVELGGVVDAVTHKITAEVPHFTIFAIMAHALPPAAPAALSLSNLLIKPAEVKPQETVTVSVSLVNTGGTEGSYHIVLKIDGVEESERSVKVAPGLSQDVSFSVTRDKAGSYNVALDGLSGKFIVVGSSTPLASPPAAKAEPKVNWPAIGGGAGGVILIALLLVFLARRRAR